MLEDPVKQDRIAGQKARDAAIAIGFEEIVQPLIRILDQGNDLRRQFPFVQFQCNFFERHRCAAIIYLSPRRANTSTFRHS